MRSLEDIARGQTVVHALLGNLNLWQLTFDALPAA